MNTLPFPQFSKTRSRFSDLGTVNAEALRLIRLWFWGPSHHTTVRLAVSVQLGAKQARCVVAALEDLDRIFGPQGQMQLRVLPPDTDGLSVDELSLVTMLKASQTEDGLPVAHGPLPRPGQTANQALGALRVLAQTLAERARRTPSSCPIACPSRASCPDRAKLKVIK
jgi:hypothetical protein